MHVLESYSDGWFDPERADKAKACYVLAIECAGPNGRIISQRSVFDLAYSQEFVYPLKYSLLLASQMPRKQWFESFLKLLLSLKCSHLSSLLISPALEWVRETLNCPFSLAECNIALLCDWVMVCYEWRNCPNKARNAGFPHQALIMLNSNFPITSTVAHAIQIQATSNRMIVFKTVTCS